ncbi:MAG TPA: SCP2 sterol-binding domain-containing protein, partial [Polyangiaceae bacterium]|nr:SCP2 sterol-binding domain-containing protein [Polyangiaceae bacterium]
KLTNPESQWTVDLKSAKVTPGEAAKAECTLELSDADFQDMTSGKADPMKLFMDKKLKISGNVMASQKLEFLKKIDKNAAASAVAAKKSAGLVPTPVTAPKPSANTNNAPKIFEALTKRIQDNPKLASEIGAVIQFVVDGKKYDVGFDAKQGSAPAAIVTINDEDLTELAKGASVQSLYQKGQLRVDGDVRLAHKLGIFKGVFS